MELVALEEHFVTAEVLDAWQSLDPHRQDLSLKPSSEGDGVRRLLDFGAERLTAMDEAGINVAVLSLTTPGAQDLDPAVAVKVAWSANDRVAAAVRNRLDRFQGFATLHSRRQQPFQRSGAKWATADFR